MKIKGTSRPAAITTVSLVTGTNVVNAAPRPATDKSTPSTPSGPQAVTVLQPPAGSITGEPKGDGHAKTK